MNPQVEAERKTQIETGLRMHTGTTQWFLHPARQFTYTEGVRYLAKEASAYWLLDLIASWQTTPALRGEAFVVWKLTVNPDRSANAVAEDGNDRELARQLIPWTDFPLDAVTLYLTDDVLLLPSEY